MAYDAQCNVTTQNCASLFKDNDPPYQHGSCVKDLRLNIGRCGWPGAACKVQDGYSNCLESASASVCQKGVCVGYVLNSDLDLLIVLIITNSLEPLEPIVDSMRLIQTPVPLEEIPPVAVVREVFSPQ